MPNIDAFFKGCAAQRYLRDTCVSTFLNLYFTTPDKDALWHDPRADGFTRTAGMAYSYNNGVVPEIALRAPLTMANADNVLNQGWSYWLIHDLSVDISPYLDNQKEFSKLVVGPNGAQLRMLIAAGRITCTKPYDSEGYLALDTFMRETGLCTVAQEDKVSSELKDPLIRKVMPYQLARYFEKTSYWRYPQNRDYQLKRIEKSLLKKDVYESTYTGLLLQAKGIVQLYSADSVESYAEALATLQQAMVCVLTEQRRWSKVDDLRILQPHYAELLGPTAQTNPAFVEALVQQLERYGNQEGGAICTDVYATLHHLSGIAIDPNRLATILQKTNDSVAFEHMLALMPSDFIAEYRAAVDFLGFRNHITVIERELDPNEITFFTQQWAKYWNGHAVPEPDSKIQVDTLS